MRLGLGLGLLRNGKTAAQMMADLVRANTGAFWDFSDATTLFESSDTSDPAEVNDGLQYIIPLATGGTSPVSWSQGTLALRPLWKTTYAEFNGTTQRLVGGANNLAIMRNASVGVVSAKVRLTALASERHIMIWTINGSVNSRLGLSILSTGAVRLAVRRADADAATVLDSAAGVISTGVDYTLTAYADFLTGGAGALKIYSGETEIASASLTGTGATANTASSDCALGSFATASNFLAGRVYRAAAYKTGAAPTAAQIKIISDAIGAA